MNKKAMRKDFYMEIRTSLGRFLSIFFIVALGVAFFSGIRSAQPDMLITGDTYFDRLKLMDIKAVSTLGITEDDVKAVGQVDGVAKAEGGYSLDVLCKGEENQKVLHVMSMLSAMNEVEVTEGRLPRKPDECLVDDKTDYKIGDIIWMESGTDTPVTDSLETDKLKVVGRGSSPCYISFGRGSTAIGTGSISGFVAVPEDAFHTDVYTEVYARISGADSLEAYSDAYDDRVEEVIDNIKDITGLRGEIRKKELTDEAETKLADARKELEEGKKEADEKLADAKVQIADGEAKLKDGKSQIAEGEKAIAAARTTLNEKQQELDAAKVEYESGKQQLEDGWAQYNEGYARYEQGMAEYNQGLDAYNQNLAAFKQSEEQLAQAQAEIDQGWAALTKQRQELDSGWAQYRQMIDSGDAQLQEQAEALKQQLDEREATYTAYRAQAEPKLQASQQQVDAGREELEAGRPQLEAASAQLAQALAPLNEAKATLDASRAQLEESQAQLDSAQAQITDGQAQIDNGFTQISEQEANLSKAKAEIAGSEPDLAKAKEEYEKARKEADDKIADGEKELRDAEKEVKKIGNPKWYVNDRTSLPEHSGYGENADRMKAIGEVFPVLFFLVAALISLTSMTRMVEEQRLQVGTMKALGYGKFAIASKYMGYAFVATMGGSIFGILVGEKIIPYIIIYAYGIMYHHMTDIIIPYNMYYAVMATAAALISTMAATVIACYKELAAQPAELMRPPAPKKGKRVFMERITFIWKHLSFIWKSTIRNLFRYKKRFFMTVFGIGGCMALILVGYGLKDSIFEIAQIQYKEIEVYDGMAYLQEDADDIDKEELTAFLNQEKNVDSYMGVLMKNVTLVHGSKEWDAYATVPEDKDRVNDFIKFHDRITREKYSLSDDGVIINEKTAKKLDAKVGDTIEIKDTDTGNKKVKIAAVSENYMGHYLYMSKGLYEEVYGQKFEENAIYFKTVSDSRARLQDTGGEILNQEAVINVSYLHEIERQLDDMLKSLNLVIVVLIVSAGMLAFVVLYNLNNINITERRRELATLKVLGFYDKEVSAYVYRENIILTLVGAAAGVVIGMLLHRFVIETVEVDSVMFGRNINLPSYIYSVLFTIGFSFFVNWVMYFKLKSIDMVESLKSVE